MRERIYHIIEKSDGSDKLSQTYDIFMIVVILVSLVPLAFKTENLLFIIIDKTAMVIFIIDYLLRWITADYKYGKKSVSSFLRYPFSPMAIIDLLSILPSMSIISRGFKALRILRMIRAFRVFRVLKTFRYSKSFRIIGNVIRTSKKSLIAVGILAGGYILISALIIFNVTDFAAPKTQDMTLKITIPENLNYNGLFDKVFDKYTTSYLLRRVKTTDFGTLFDLVYSVRVRTDADQKKFIDDIRALNGNLNVTLVLYKYDDQIYDAKAK